MKKRARLNRQMNNKPKALVLFSGGQDSTICLYWALRKFGPRNVRALSFDYGQRHRRELASARAIAKLAGVPHIVLPISTFKGLGDNALTGKLTVRSGKGRHGLPNTFVPGRNIIFLSFAAAHAYEQDIHDLVTGVCEADYSGYPDCHKDTMKALERTLTLGMDYPIRIHTPLIFMTKAKALGLAERLGAFPALALSHTCYNNKRPGCGKCPACILRAKAFREAGLKDPAV